MEDVETYDVNVRDAGVLFYAKVIEDYEPPTEVRHPIVIQPLPRRHQDVIQPLLPTLSPIAERRPSG